MFDEGLANDQFDLEYPQRDNVIEMHAGAALEGLLWESRNAAHVTKLNFRFGPLVLEAVFSVPGHELKS